MVNFDRTAENMAPLESMTCIQTGAGDGTKGATPAVIMKFAPKLKRMHSKTGKPTGTQKRTIKEIGR